MTIVNEFNGLNGLITETEWCGKKKLHFTNFGTRKTNKEGKEVMHGYLVNTEDIAIYLDKSPNEVADVVDTILDVENIKKSDFKYYNSEVDKAEKVSSWKCYSSFKYNTDGKKPDKHYPIYWLKESQANKVVKYLGGTI